MQRTQKIDVRGLELVIGWLSSEQVEEMMDEEAPSDMAGWRRRAWRTTIQGLNNALNPALRTAEPYTERRLREILDDRFPGGEVQSVLNEIHSAVLEFSGLKVGSVGETKAPAESTSTPSAAA